MREMKVLIYLMLALSAFAFGLNLAHLRAIRKAIDRSAMGTLAVERQEPVPESLKRLQSMERKLEKQEKLSDPSLSPGERRYLEFYYKVLPPGWRPSALLTDIQPLMVETYDRMAAAEARLDSLEKEQRRGADVDKNEYR